MRLDLVLLQQRFVFVNFRANVALVLALLDFFSHRNDRRVIVVQTIVLLQAVHNAFLYYFVHSGVVSLQKTVSKLTRNTAMLVSRDRKGRREGGEISESVL